MNKVNDDITKLVELRDSGLIDSEVFIAAIKKIVHKPTIVSVPLQEDGSEYPNGSVIPIEGPLQQTVMKLPLRVNKDGVPFTSEKDKTTRYVSKGSPLTATYTPEQVNVTLYSEDRSHLPEHAKQVLSWIDEAWDKTFREYNDTKKDWEREVDEEGNIHWKHLPSEEMDKDMRELGHIFNLHIDGCDC